MLSFSRINFIRNYFWLSPEEQREWLGSSLAFPGGASGKKSDCQCRRRKRNRFDPRVRKIPWRREWLPTPVFLPGKSHGQRSLEGYSSRGCKESDTTEQLSTAQHHFYQPPAAIQLPSRQRWSFPREACRDPLWEEMTVSRQQTDLMIIWFRSARHTGLVQWECPLPLCPLLPWSCFAGSVSPSPTLRTVLSWFAAFWVLGILHRENGYGLIGQERRQEREYSLQETAKHQDAEAVSECEQVRSLGWRGGVAVAYDSGSFTDLGKYNE